MSGTRPDDLRPGTELFVNGNRENSNNYLYDGIDNNTRLTLVTVMRPNVEAIKEFKVQTNLYSADQGRNPGGQINVVTKSGGNTIHGVGLRVPAQRPVRRQQLLRQPRRPGETAIRAEPVRRRDRRADCHEQDVLLRRLRRVPPGAGARVRQHRADSENAAGRFQRGRDDLRPADDGRGPRRRRHAPAVPRQRDSAKPLGPGDGQADQRVSGADHVGIVQQPGHDPVAHAELESVRRARRSHAKRPEQLPRPLFLVEDVDDQPVHVRSRPASRPVESRRPRQRGHVRRALRICWPSTPCSAGCTCSRRVCCWIRAPATTTSISTSRRPTSSSGDQLGEQLGVPNANQQLGQDGIPIFSPANYTGIGHSRSLPIFRHEKTFQVVANLTFAGDKHTIKAGFDLRRRHMGEFQTNRGNGRFNFSPNITNNPANNTGGHVDGVVPARRAEPDRAGLPAGRRRRHARHRIQRLCRRRLARDAEADAEPRPSLRARHAVHRSRQSVGQLRSGHRHGPGRRPQRRERDRRASRPSRRPSRRASASPTSVAATHGRARRSGDLLEHARQRRQRPAAAPPRAVRADLQLQPRQPVRHAAA